MTDDAQEGRFFSNDAVWCSSGTGWSSAHLRRYRHQRVVEEVKTPPSLDHVLVLVVCGHTLIESFKAGRWRSGAHAPGNVAMTCSGESNRLRWRGPETHETLHLHLPAATIASAITDVRETEQVSYLDPRQISTRDALIENVMLALVRAAEGGAPDLYASSAGLFLARHLVSGRPDGSRMPLYGSEDARMRRVENFMHAYLATDISLQDLAAVADCSTFQLIRLCKAQWGKTPFRRLTELRMEVGRHLLSTTSVSIISIAFDCGYGNPSHFATAFRRTFGISPSDYRRI